MKHLTATFFVSLVLSIPSISFACPVLEGTWLSSKALFINFNKQWANIEKPAWNFMLQSQGLEKIEFTSTRKMIIRTEKSAIIMGSKTIERPSTTEVLDFEVLGCTPQSMVIQYTRHEKPQISQLQFENDNTYWEYMGKPGRSGNGHIREYYTKQL